MVLHRVLNNKLKVTGGFTIAELLITLGILGIVATFTIPKILSSSDNMDKIAKTKNFANMVMGAYADFAIENTVTSTTTAGDFTPYMNFANVDTVNLMDNGPWGTTKNCGTDATIGCLRLHDGGVVLYGISQRFNDTQPTNGLTFLLDPDGASTGNSDSVQMVLFANGTMTSRENTPVVFYNNMQAYAPCSNCDPEWFTWDE